MPAAQPAASQAPPSPGAAPTVALQHAVQTALYLHDMRNLFVGRTQEEVEVWVRAALSNPG
jgi:hypothetical protein